MDFSGGPVVKNSPANAGDSGSISDPGMSHILQGNKVRAPQIMRPALKPMSCSYWAWVPQLLKPGCPRAHAPQEKPPQEAHTLQPGSSPCSRNYRKPVCSNKDPVQPKINK